MTRAREEGRNRALSAADAALWAQIAASVRPLAKARALRAEPPERAREVRAVEKKAPIPAAAVARKPPPPMPLAPTSRERLDRTAERNLKRGAVAIGGRLDLHGFDREEAHRAVGRFLARLAENGERVALVITGKGGRSAETGGVLRAEFPRWLSESPLARLVLAWRPAAPRHGGAGAFYVLLRRKGARP